MLFIIELAPRLKEYGKAISVTLKAKNIEENSYDLNKIVKFIDYIIIETYDQYEVGSKEEKTVIDLNWVEANIKKIIENDKIEPSKLILGMTLYEEKETTNGIDSSVAKLIEKYNLAGASFLRKSFQNTNN